MFHVDLLTPYKETATYGSNYTRPPPDLINGEEEYKVERIIDSRQFGRGRQVQYLVKWKGYPDADNQWLKWQDINAPDLIAEYQKENPDAITHIRRGWSHDESITSSIPHSISYLVPHMSNASILPRETTKARGYHLTLYETASAQVDNPTDGAAILHRVMDLAQNTAINKITGTGTKAPVNSDRDAGMDANTRERLDSGGGDVDGTNPQTCIRHATPITTTKGVINTPIDVNALEPGSPSLPSMSTLSTESRLPRPNDLIRQIFQTGRYPIPSFTSQYPRVMKHPSVATLMVPPSDPMKSGTVTGVPVTSSHQTSHLDSYETTGSTLSHFPSLTRTESLNTLTLSTSS